MSNFTALAIAGLGTTEILIILAILVLLFGAKKLPDLARGSGRALRIFKAETKGLMDDDDETKDEQSEGRPSLEAQRSNPPAEPGPVSETYEESARRSVHREGER